MASTFYGLDIALSGLYASNAKLNTTSHNIANAETEGYTRQSVVTKASKALKSYSTYGMVGSGVEIDSIIQERNSYFDVKYWKSNTVSGEYGTKSYYMNSVENYFNELNDDGFTTTFDDLFNALSELSNEPSNLEKRQHVTQLARTFTEYFNYMKTNLETVQDDLNFEIKNTVDTVNNLAEEIANINHKINTLEVTGVVANDLRDQRAVLIDRLSNICSITVEEGRLNKLDENIGQQYYVVKIDGQILVDTFDYNKLVCKARDEKDNQNDIDGLYDVQWSTDSYGGQSFDMYSESLGGVLQGLVQMRDGNNLENLRGKVEAKEGDTTVKLTDATINSLKDLNIPETGYLTLGGNDYKYTGFTVNMTSNPDGTSTFEYVFDLEKSVIKDITTYNATVGEAIDYKGVTFYAGRLNEFLRVFTDKFNTLCNKGQDLYGELGQDLFIYKDKISGEELELTEGGSYTSFTSSMSTYYKMTAGNVCINQALLADPSKFPAASDIDKGVENNDIIREMVALKADEKMFKQGKPAAFLQTLISELGVDTAAAKQFADNQENILFSIGQQRLSVSGVDNDEEAMDLITNQKMYQLNAKVITVMNEILNTLINEMGV